uniref:Excisionase family DNA binding domain-containing protein n=1 Tax=Eubacterium plexicaudatum ASF492 TaxID=1235802 RepID=N2BB47_9FIRM
MSEIPTINASEKFLLTFDEAAGYFGIGRNKLRNMASYGAPLTGCYITARRL